MLSEPLPERRDRGLCTKASAKEKETKWERKRGEGREGEKAERGERKRLRVCMCWGVACFELTHIFFLGLTAQILGISQYAIQFPLYEKMKSWLAARGMHVPSPSPPRFFLFKSPSPAVFVSFWFDSINFVCTTHTTQTLKANHSCHPGKLSVPLLFLNLAPVFWHTLTRC